MSDQEFLRLLQKTVKKIPKPNPFRSFLYDVDNVWIGVDKKMVKSLLTVAEQPGLDTSESRTFLAFLQEKCRLDYLGLLKDRRGLKKQRFLELKMARCDLEAFVDLYCSMFYSSPLRLSLLFQKKTTHL
eukprot:TRINITY_DN4337_c0_g1_i1.p1 TRINITY_DN4337_c0_g1~~TRINITY_DN4337_c0_g1_i1.p1  ORF type:complete len:129 (+),score=27.92 TRINITY_DN4337_c0_g1_i1:76-462(+)